MISLPPIRSQPSRMDRDPRPYVRWWWFSNPIDPADLDRQVSWAASNGFGGVEIAWVYPQPGKGPGLPWLSAEWSGLVLHAREACDREGIGCDLTFGTLWPFGGSFVEESFAAKTWRGPSDQRLDRSWELSHRKENGRILDHLSAPAFARYAAVMGGALEPALRENRGNSLFCDSWEVETDGLWTDGFGEAFIGRFGYDLLPFMGEIDAHPDVRYDYRSLLAEYVLKGFYLPYTEYCHGAKASARVQCHGAPTDVLAAYAVADVPESEALLFDPEFSSIAASSALISGRRTVSCESFTCLYGWIPWPGPAPRLGEERLDDLKLLADSLAASGVNHFVWHGMPQKGEGGDARFYAGVHVGPESAIAPRYREFNAYLAKVSSAMKRGKSYGRLACYLPLEDAWMAGELPEELRKPSARYYWELQHLARPAAARPYAPLWISSSFLSGARFEDGELRIGEAGFEALFIESEYLERDALAAITALAEKGLPVALGRLPLEPGRRASADYPGLLERLLASPMVRDAPEKLPRLKPVLAPARKGGILPPYWVRRDGDRFLLFLAHPEASGIVYPLPWGRAENAKPMKVDLVLDLGGYRREFRADFPAVGALLYSIAGAMIEEEPLGFDPA
jgi:hypothetical protein